MSLRKQPRAQRESILKKSNLLKNRVVLCLFGIVCAGVTSCNQEVKPALLADYANISDEGFCKSAWFPHSQTPPPEEGDNSPFDSNNTTMTIFHQWSWQKFLWLTRPTSNGKVFFQDSLLLVDKYLKKLPTKAGVNLVLSSTGQAGKMGVLTSNPKFNNQKEGDTVFYAIHTNQLFMDAAKSMKEKIFSNPSNTSNNLTFPIGALELKTSWIRTNAIPEELLEKYYTTTAYFPNTNSIEEVALLGMHVVTVVKNQPGFIWSTFEHQGMAPSYQWPEDIVDYDVPVTSNQEMLFFQKGDTATIENLKAKGKSKSVFTIYQYGIPILKERGIYTDPKSYMPTSQREPQNYNHLDSLNQCVISKLDDVWQYYFYDGSVWLKTDTLSHNQQTDSINNLKNHLGDFQPGSLARGSGNAANISMETFQQISYDKPVSSIHSLAIDDLTNCFSCHNASIDDPLKGLKLKTSPLFISHIFRNYLTTE